MKSGYSRETIAANINMLRDEGMARSTAIHNAHSHARENYWKKHPSGWLPNWIFPHPIHGRQGPNMRQGVSIVKRSPRKSVLPNPAQQVEANGFELAGAHKMFSRFVGRATTKAGLTKKPVIPDAMACIGRVSVIQYVAERDGKTNEYRHPFRSKSRPLLCVSPDGDLVLMLGGAFTFTADGFVDR